MEVQITHICSITFQSYIDSKLQKSIETNFFLMTYFQNEIPLFMIFYYLGKDLYFDENRFGFSYNKLFNVNKKSTWKMC